jgi:hypothetical protein
VIFIIFIDEELKQREEVSVIKIHIANSMNLWGITLNYIVAFALYPGVLLEGKINFIKDENWRIWFVIFTY